MINEDFYLYLFMRLAKKKIYIYISLKKILIIRPRIPTSYSIYNKYQLNQTLTQLLNTISQRIRSTLRIGR